MKPTEASAAAVLTVTLSSLPHRVERGFLDGWLLVRLASIAVALFVAAVPVPAEQLFPGPVSVVGSKALAIATSDLDGDGYLDIVVGNHASKGPSVLYGRAEGGFSPEFQLPGTVSFGLEVLAVDMNRDGALDLVVAGPGRFRVYLATGARSFADDVLYYAHNTSDVSASAATGDFNGDSNPDVVLGGSDDVAIAFGVGDGTVAPPVRLDGMGGNYYVLDGDFNTDGCLDFIADGRGTGFRFWRGRCDGSFSRGAFSASPGDDAAAGDFDGDGVLDVATARFGLVHTHIGSGNGSFLPVVTYDTGISHDNRILAVDLNADGYQDLAVTALFGEVVIGVLLSNGDGTFQPCRIFPATLFGGAMTRGDYDRDGHVDIAYVSWGSGVGPDPSLTKAASPFIDAHLTAVMFGDGQGGLSNERVEHFDVGEDPTEIVVADFDGDGVQDVATTNSVPGDVSVLLGGGDGTFAEAGRFPVGTQPIALDAGSLDPGGTTDLVVVNAGSADATVLLGAGDGTFGVGQTLALGTTPAAVVLADFNGDGALDLAIASPDDDAARIYAGLGDGGFEFALALPVGAEPVALATTDLDGNGAADLVVVNFASGDVSVLLGVGDGTFQPEARHATGIVGGPPTLPIGPRAIATADVNRDGFPDGVVGGGSETTQLVVMHGDGQGGLASPVVRTVGLVVEEVEVADVDGNGWDDLITGHRSSVLHVLLGDGEGFSPAMGFAGESRGGLAVGEFNRDGLLDLAAAGVIRDQVAIIPNRLRVPIRFDSATTIAWRRLVGYDRFNTYRGDLADLQAPAPGYGVCRNASDPDLADNVLVDVEVPAEGAGFFYLMSRVRDGVETDLGAANNGEPRVPALPCE